MNTSASSLTAPPALFLPAAQAEVLNQHCVCRTLDPVRLQHQLASDPALAGLAEDIAASRPHLFSATMVFISPADLAQMAAVITAIHQVAALPGWQQQALARAPAIAAVDQGPRGVFMGFDFHRGADGPRLIEINTNAGGAFLNSVLRRAQRACCAEFAPETPAAGLADPLDAQWLQMFQQEWQLAERSGSPQRLLIVDEAPQTQYLYPEFLLARRLFESAGLDARIAAPEELVWDGAQLRHQGDVVDLVYNRLTDFYLQAPASAALRQAHIAGAVLLTPHPRAHALYADKHNLALLTDADWLQRAGLPAATIDTLLRGIPRTRPVRGADGEALWAARRELFFKPATGFGSRAAWRGDKLTRRVWQEILAGDYVAQALVPPARRSVPVEDGAAPLKYDLRAYVYDGHVQLLAARLYSGQTTNFRTPGGGFAPVAVAA